MNFVPKDVVIFPESTTDHPDRWVAMNVFTRTSFGISSRVMAYLGQIGTVEAQQDDFEEYLCWDIEYFSNEEGLLADPSRFRRDPKQWKELRLDRPALDLKLRSHFLLIDDEVAYRERFKSKKNLLDRDHFGNFHQQHGQHLLLVKREDPSLWWMRQKFSDSNHAVREDTLYGAVQWHFLKDYFTRTIKPGMRIIDLGCGTGIYSNFMASCGAEVIGIDPNEDYLEVARTQCATNASFHKANIGEVGGLSDVPGGWADMVFMSDALLFYFMPFFPGQKADLHVLLDDVRRILNPRGRFVSVEPHGVFYLCPWLGEEDRPFTVVTEYLHKFYGIVPPFSWLFHELGKANFAVTDLLEIQPAEYFKSIDPRGYHFASEFPLWQLLELAVHERQ